MSLELCFRKINVTARCRVGWKEKTLQISVPILLVANKERALVILDKREIYWWSNGEGKVKNCLSSKSIDV